MDDQTSIHFFAHPLPGGEQQFLRRIEEAASSLNRNGHRVPAPLQTVGLANIKQIAVGPNHAAFLLNDGRVARLGLSVFQDRLDLTGKDDGPGKQYSCRDKPSGGGAGGDGGASAAAASRTAKIRRVMMAARRPGRSGVIVGSRPMIPASAIPEELVAQAQVVLQGKSRDVIVRELQRTNLNVNEAVNNLLSRDDDEGDELDEATDAYLPEELLTLLDAGLQSGEHAGVVLDADALYSGDGFEYLVARDMARRKMERDKEKDRARTSELVGSQHNYGSPITPGASLIYWTEMDEKSITPSFIAISALYSELLALSEDGRLYSWPWNQERGQGIHPKTEAVGLHQDERITALTTCMTRCALVTDKHRVASFVDSALGLVASTIMDAPAYDLGEMPVSIHVCPLYACARTAHGGSVFWWGVLPFNERRKKWEKLKSRSKKHVTFDMNEIKEGCEVRTKSNPIYPAGAVGVNFANGYPQVGELMEAAWTLTETCRFRVRSPDQLKTTDGWKPVKGDSVAADASDSSAARTNVRKRPADNEPSAKEEAWALKDVVFVDEGKSQDAGIVEIVDGAYCGVVFAKDIKSGTDGGDSFEERKRVMRLMRKDDLQIVSATAIPRSPESFQRLPKKLALPHAGKGVIDLMLDSNGIRILFERHGKIRLMRLSVFGKIASDHELPLVASAFFGTGTCTPKIENYGDEGVCVLRDGNGCVVPMLRDSVGGFREPSPLSLAAVPLLSVGIQPLLKSASTKFNRLALTVATVRPQNLMQLVQFCDVDSVKSFVNELEKEQNLDKAQAEILNARVDGNRNILHVALLSAVGNTNKEHVDSSNPPTASSAANAALVDQDDLVAAGLARDAYEARWQQMVTRRFGGRTHPFGIGDLMMSDRQQPQVVLQQQQLPPPPPMQQQQQQETPASPDNQGQAIDDDARTPILVGYDSPRPEDMPQKTTPQTSNAEPMDTVEGPKVRRPISDSKQRQRNALEIVKFLCEHPLMNAYMFELLSTRDMTGQTPFMLAIHARAYSAAMTMWEAAQKVAKSSGQSQQQQYDAQRQMIFPPGSRPSDSPLFVLSYNDTCSFTWTGDEHINQDIFECRTCGLVGSLCCCSECAYICHKNHDCKLKRTSPTAYCDCWEKCACKALVAGNQNVRFDLFNKLIQDTNLVTKTNSRGEHLLLFLARTVGRQTNEQKQYNGSRSKARKTDGDMTMPEHDLEPPKFARKALERLLSDWSALKSMIMLGVKQMDDSQLIDEDRFYLNSQNGVSYLDRFVFTLLSRCGEQNLDTLLSTMNKEVQRVSGKDEQADFVVGRFVRSVVRVFVIVSTCANQKDQRRKAALSTTLKCRRVMQALITFALDELGHAADAAIAPVRMGLVKPTHAFTAISSSLDAVDALEKLFASEPIFSSGNVGGASTMTSAATNQPAPPTTAHSSARRTARISAGGRRSSSTARTVPSEARRTTFEFDDFDENDDDSSRRPSHGDDPAVLAAAAAAGAVGAQEPASLLAPLAGSDNESDSESEGEVPSSRTEQNSADSAATIAIGGGHPPPGDMADASQQRRRGQQESNTEDSGQGSRMWALDDAMEDDSRDYYYSDGESVDSVSSQGQNPEDDTLEDNGDDDGEDGDETLGRDGIVNDPDDDGDRDDDGDSDHDSDSDRDSFATQQSQPLISVPPTLSQAAAAAAAAAAATNTNNNSNVANILATENAAAGQLPTSQAQLLQAQSIAAQRTAAAAQNHLYRTTRTSAAPTLTWAVRRMSRSGTSMLSSSAIAPLAAGATQATNAAGQLTSGTVPPPERGGGSFYIVDTSLPPPSVRYHHQQQQQPTSALPDGSHQLGQAAAMDAPSTSNTSALLGRTFAILIRQIADLLPILADYKLMAPSLKCVLVVGPEESTAVRDRLENRLKTSWSWLFSALDTLEAQLRFGHALLGSQDHQQMFGVTPSATNRQSSSAVVGASSRPALPQRYGYDSRRASNMIVSSADGEQMHSGSARKDFVGYLLSLMRAHSSEHGDDLPVIDYGSLRPVAHIVDSLFALMDAVSRADTPPPDAVNLADLFDQFADQEGESSAAAEAPNESSMRRFFQRSKSLLYPGVSTRLGAFDHSINESLPLADKPHLLRPETSKERMFGVPGKAMIVSDHKEAAKDTGNPNPTHQSLAEPMTSAGRVGSGGETTPTASTSRSAPIVCPDTPVTSAVRTVLSSTVDMAAAVSSPTKRPNVIVHAKSASVDKSRTQKVDATPPPPGVARVTLAQIAGLGEKTDDNGAQILMGRWKRSLTLLAKVFHEDLSSYVPSEQSVLAQMAGFIVRETKFRKEMERLRGAQSKDLVLEVDRERHLLIQQTIKQLNQAFQRRSSCAVAGTAPLAVHKVKVTFKEEPGEGTGVARSFYAAVAEAFLTIERLPNLELCQATPGGTSAGIGGRAQQQHFLNRMRTRERTREFHRRRTGATTRRYPLSADAPPFYLSGGGEEGAPVTNWDPSKQTLGERLFPRVRQLRPSLSNKITGMLLELPPHQLIALLTSEESLRAHVEDAVDQITANMNPGDIRDESSQDAMDVAQNLQGQDPSVSAQPLSPSKTRKSVSTPNLHGLNPVLDPDEIQDTAPLFYQPGKAGFYSPVPGKNSAERINAFRNVGRLMGICLLQNELLPMHLCRHVFKFVLDRPINWFDLAFFDPALFESLRSLATHDRNSFQDLHLTFCINVAEEEGGGVIDLKANGSNIMVAADNVVEYVYRYVEMRMLKNSAKALEAIKQGVYDVLPSDALKGLTSEDLRLILCGTHEISIRLLQSYTSFADESSAPADQLARFKRWFWYVVSKLNAHDRQDLVYFWTGSPALPSSEDGFQPLPSVMIRPADDHHLPTANTCISRLYLPLYSSKKVLKQKLTTAIKARTFGFV